MNQKLFSKPWCRDLSTVSFVAPPSSCGFWRICAFLLQAGKWGESMEDCTHSFYARVTATWWGHVPLPLIPLFGAQPSDAAKYKAGRPGDVVQPRAQKGRMGIRCPAFWNNPGCLPGAGNNIIKDSFQQSRKKWLYHERNVPREIHQTSEGPWHEHSVARSKAPWLSLGHACKLEPLVPRNPLTGCARALKQGAQRVSKCPDLWYLTAWSQVCGSRVLTS